MYLQTLTGGALFRSYAESSPGEGFRRRVTETVSRRLERMTTEAISVIRLLHTADVHLDASRESLGERATDLRQRTWATWERLIDTAIEEQVELFVVAGDLFDRRSPAADTVARAISGLKRLATGTPPIDTVLLPGTHDCWAEGALWDSPAINALPDHVHLLRGPAACSVHLPPLDLMIHGCAHACGIGGQRPVAELRASPEAAINLGVAHGSWERGDISGDSSMFSDEEIAASGLDYLALGHWHSFDMISSGEVTAVNPGSPEVPGFGNWKRGAVALVTLGDGPARVERREVGSLVAETLEIDAADLSGTEDLIRRIEERADEDLLLEITLTGLAPPGVVIDIDEAIERLAGAFFALRLGDESHPALDRLDEAELDTRLTLGRFVELARERIEAADGEHDRRVAERALQIGVSMLRREGGGG